MSNQSIRVRFAPSPTGPLHIGGVRTALYNYLFAKKLGGTFILRIEDTDSNRFVPGAEEYIIDSFKWCGLPFDEGVGIGGPYAPYRQSERKEIYKQYAQQLIREDKAYYAFDTPEELENLRKKLESEKASNTSYSYHVRKDMNNSLTLGMAASESMINEGIPYVIRIKMPENTIIEVNDIIRGKIEVNTSTLDDKVLWKSSDQLPTYHLANVTDDFLMKISHVIRGEEWLPSLPLHVLLYQYLGWQASMPQFAHLPLLLKPDGKGKLSKRDGDKMGFPVFPLEWIDPQTGEKSMGYRESGYFPDALVNFLSFLGWNPGTEKELFSLNELIDAFSLEHVSKSGARFDFEKAKWFNHQYLMQKSPEEIGNIFMKINKEKLEAFPQDYIIKVCGLVKDRVSFVHEMWSQSYFFFEDPQQYDQELIKKKWKSDTNTLLSDAINVLDNISLFTAPAIHDALHEFCQQKNIGLGMVMIPLRLSLVGAGIGPDLPLILEMLGKQTVIKRIQKSINTIKSE